MNDMKLVLHISQNGAGQVKAELEGVSKAEAGIGAAGTAAAPGVQQLGGALGGAAGSAKRMDASVKAVTPEVERLNGAMAQTASTSTLVGKSVASIGFAAGAYAASHFGVALSKTADQATNMASRVKVAADGVIEYQRAMSGTYSIAQRYGVQQEGLANFYSRTAQAARDAGKTQSELLTVVSAVSASFKTSGANAGAQAATITQLSQSLGTATVQWEDFGQIVDTDGRLFNAILQAMGKTFGEFKEEMSKGLITNTMLFDAILKASAKLEAEAEQMANTNEAAWTRVTNAWTKAVGQINEASKATEESSGIIDKIAHGVEYIGDLWARAATLQKQYADEYARSKQRYADMLQGDPGRQDRADEVAAKEYELSLRERINRMLSAPSPAAPPKSVQQLIAEASQSAGIPANLLTAIGRQESGLRQFNADGSVKLGWPTKYGRAVGMMQLLPSTAAKVGVDPYDQAGNIMGGAKYLAELSVRYKGQQDALLKTIAAYNAGPGNVEKLGLDFVLTDRFARMKNGKGQTKEYVANVLGFMKADAKDDPLLKSIDLGAYEKRLDEAGQLFKAKLNSQVNIAEEASEGLASSQKAELAALQASAAERSAQRVKDMAGLTGAQRDYAENTAQKAEHQDQETLIRARLAMEKQAIASAEAVARARVDAAKQELAYGAKTNASQTEQLATQDKLRAAQSDLRNLANERRTAEAKAAEDIANLSGKAAAAVVDDNTAQVGAYQEHQAEVAKLLRSLDDELALTGMTGKALAVETALRRVNADAASDEGKKIAEKVGKLFDEQKAAEKAADQAKIYEQAWEQATRRVDDTFRNLWADVFTGSKTVMESIKSTFLQMLAEMAHAAITRPILVSILGALGAPGGAAAGQSGIGGVLGQGVSGALGKGMTSLFGSAAGGILGGLGTAATGGLIGAGLPALLGIKGGSPLANYALPAVGGIGGAFAGAALAPALSAAAFSGFGGVAGGTAAATAAGLASSLAVPVIGAIGGLVMALVSTLIKKAPPKAAADLAVSSSNQTTVTATSQSGGGKSAQLVGLGMGLAAGMGDLERMMGLELGAIGIGLSRRGRDMNLAGSGASGTFYAERIGGAYDKKGNLNEAVVQDALDRFGAAMLKRREVLAQIDDDLLKGAVRSLDKLSGLSEKVKTVNDIRAFEGERTSVGDTLDTLVANVTKYRQNVVSFTGRRNRAAEIAKLNAAAQEQFSTVALDVRGTYDALVGNDNSLSTSLRKAAMEARALAVQNEELSRAARRLGVEYQALSAAELEAARRATLKKSIVDIDNLLTSASTSLAAVRDGLRGITQTTASLTGQIAQGMESLSTLSGAGQAKAIKDIADLASKRFNLELENYQALYQAAQQVASTVTGMKLGDASPLSLAEQEQVAQKAYWDALAKAQAGDAGGMAALPQAAQQYLAVERERYGSGQQYIDVFRQVTDALSMISDRVTSGADSSLQGIYDRLSQTLTSLDGVLNTLVQNNGGVADAAASIVTAVDGTTRAVRALGGVLK